MNRKQIEKVLSFVLIPLFLLPLMTHWAYNDNHLNRTNFNYGKNLLTTLEPNSIFMTEGGDNQVFTSAYNQMAEFKRPDVTIYDQKGNVFYRIYGDFRYLSGREVNIKRNLVDFEIFRRGRPVYLTWRRRPNISVCGDLFLRRYGILYKVMPLKYKILLELDARIEMNLGDVHKLIKSYYQSKSIMAQHRKNKKELEYFAKVFKNKYVQYKNYNKKFLFIDKSEIKRLHSSLKPYYKFINNALTRKVNINFTGKLLAGLQKEGYIKLRGNKVLFVKDLPKPLNVTYWKKYQFDYAKAKNSHKWDYLTREIITNYNFYFASFFREEIRRFLKQLTYYRGKVKQLYGKRKKEIEAVIHKLNLKVNDYRKRIDQCYKRAEKYGEDMTAIHHNLGVIYSQRKDYKKALESFKKGVKSDSYSYSTIYSYILMSLKLAIDFKNPEKEEPALRKAKKMCRAVYRKIRMSKNAPRGGYERTSTYRRFSRLERTLINARLKYGIDQVIRVKKQLDLDRKNIVKHERYINLLFRRIDHEGVVKAFAEAPNEKWNRKTLIFYYATSWQMRGKADKAIELYERLLLMFPKFYHAMFRLAGLYEQKGYVKKALVIYKSIDDIDEDTIKPREKGIFRQYRNISKQKIKALEK